MTVTPVSPGLLKGIRVLDLTQFEAGTTCTGRSPGWVPTSPRWSRRAASWPHRLWYYYFMMYNANKRSLTVNLKDERGLALVKEMVKKADVFTENFAPGAVERLGLGYDVVPAVSTRRSSMLRSGSFGDGSPFQKGCRSTRSRRLAAVR